MALKSPYMLILNQILHFFSPEIETDAKNGYWPKNRPIIKIYNFDPNIMKVGENINITRV